MDVFEDRDFDITSECEISIGNHIAAVEAALADSPADSE
jgi:hypothetical protein